MRLPRLLPAVHRPSGARLRYRAVPDRYLAFPDFALGPAQWDDLQIPVGLAFFFRNSVARPDRRVLPGPGGRHRVRAAAWTPGTRSLARQPRAGRAAPTTPRRCWCGRPATSAPSPSAYLVPDRRLLRVRRAGCGRCGAASTAARRPAACIDDFFADSVAGTVRDRRSAEATRMSDARRSPSLDVAPEPYAASPDADRPAAASRSRRRRPVHAIALRCQVRIEPQRRGYADDEAAGLIDLFGARERWASTLHAVPVAAVQRDGAGFTGVTEVNLPLPCTYDFEVAASKYLHALRDGDVPLLFLFSGTVFTKGPRRLRRRSRSRGTARTATTCPVSVWRDLIAAALPEHRLAAAGPRHPRRAAAYKVGARPARPATTRSTDAAGSRRGRVPMTPPTASGPAPSPTRCSTRAICSTRTGRTRGKNQSRWQFGVLGPPGGARPASARSRGCASELLLARRAGTRVTVVAALPAAAAPRASERVERQGGFEPVDELCVGSAVAGSAGTRPSSRRSRSRRPTADERTRAARRTRSTSPAARTSSELRSSAGTARRTAGPAALAPDRVGARGVGAGARRRGCRPG